MNLLKVIELENSIDYMDRIHICLEERLNWLSDREPEYEGSVHDEWCDKYEALEQIIEMIDEYFDEESTITKSILAADIVTQISNYQMCYGGISRLVI